MVTNTQSPIPKRRWTFTEKNHTEIMYISQHFELFSFSLHLVLQCFHREIKTFFFCKIESSPLSYLIFSHFSNINTIIRFPFKLQSFRCWDTNECEIWFCFLKSNWMPNSWEEKKMSYGHRIPNRGTIENLKWTNVDRFLGTCQK